VLGAGPIKRLLMLLAIAAAGAFPAAARADLAASLAGQMRAAGPGSGAYVVDSTTGATLFSWKASTPRILASNVKLFTTAALLGKFGADGKLVTQVLSDAPIGPDGVLKGDLWLKGGGDPAFGDRFYVRRHYGTGGANVEDLAVQLSMAGLIAVRGGVHGDESLFDQIRGVHDSGYDVSGWVGPLSALAFNHAYDKRRYQANPVQFAATAFRKALDGEGITPGHPAAASPAPDAAVVLAKADSLPMSALVRITNKESDNFFAETLLKALGGARAGGQGSTTAGIAAVRSYAADAGASVQLIDGSGLDHGDRASPQDVVALLNGERKTPEFPALYDSLPIAGIDGTLKKRMRKGPARRNCRAKTGSLIGVSTLSGYCTGLSGHALSFSILMSGISVSRAHKLQDRMAAALVTEG
jgi:D-alanyl-D-alanine carboxypeptidase/D-alanyl-D-alanine-endopeptidase (penicillin-binding protein 4)